MSTIIYDEYTTFDELLAADDVIMHVGTPHQGFTPHSGRYEYGSGKNPFQRSGDFISRVDKLKKDGLSEADIAKDLGFKSTTDLRNELARAKHDRREDERSEAIRLKNLGYSTTEIGRKLGKNESTIRSLLNNKHTAEKQALARTTAEFLKKQVSEKGFIDVGKGTELELGDLLLEDGALAKSLGVSKNKLEEALWILQKDGYKVYNRGISTGPGQQTITKVLCPPGTEYKDVYKDDANIKSLVDYHSDDDGETFKKKAFEYPTSLDSKRLEVRYAEQGGVKEDGLIEVRPGCKDLYLGEGVHYAQVRIMVDGTHYLKGMATYANDLPEGIDVRFNTIKHEGTPALGPKDNTVLKPIKKDPDNPFGSLIKEEGGQSHYIDDDGKEKLSLINKRGDEGDWRDWADSLPSQFLSKQDLKLIDKQLTLSYSDKKAEYDEIASLTNPNIKSKLLLDFASECDSATVHLKAAELPGQKYQVLLPLTDISDNEVYAPNFKHGDTVALVRFPHGGTFEIPILKVNNRNKQGIERISPNAKDAIGISAKVAEQLSGADFDGDTALVIPCNSPNSKVRITATKPFEGLLDFDPTMEYKIPPGDTKTKRMTKSNTQKQMGIVSNLITDMTIRGATNEELERAVKHSMVVIDAEKHGLDYQRSYKEQGIAELQKKYQGVVDPITGKTHGGASTLISLANSEARLDIKRKGSAMIDKETGKVSYKEYTETYTDKNGEEKIRQTKSPRMMEVDDAYSLSTGTPVENRYALYANQLKALANEARKLAVNTKNLEYKPSMAKLYAEEVADLMSQLNKSKKNAPRERIANALANSDVKAKMQSAEAEGNPMDKSEIKKARSIALKNRRKQVGAERVTIKISDKQWEAIQNGAISGSKLNEILNHTDMDELRQRAMPKATKELSTAKQGRIKAMASSGYTNKQIAEALGVSPSTVSKYL